MSDTVQDRNYYKKIGFKCGLEIHQRLATKEKLFCSCDASLKEDVSVGEIIRKQRAVAGELGKVDAATLFESSKNRSFVYNLFSKETCLVDIDEEPPHDLNREALEIAYVIAAAFNAKVPDELEAMRKVVVDGSDPSSFQRTILIGYDGFLEVNSRKIGVPSIFLEEESCGIEYSNNNVVVYNTDRLGVPLIEIDTAPEIETPAEAKEVAKKIGLLLRLTGKVQRGIGSIRQDVNVSIAEGARTEIKGFQDLESMAEIIDSEVERQQNLIKIAQQLKKRHASVGEPFDLTAIFHNTSVNIIRKSIQANGKVYAAALKGFKGALGTEINTGRRLGSELSDYAKLAGVGGIIHSDEDMEKYGFDKQELEAIAKRLSLGNDDAFILVTGPEETARLAINYALDRARYAIVGVPKETRGVDIKLAVTKFLRPLPGGERMYPETDVRPIEVDNVHYATLLKNKITVEAIEKELEKEIENRQLAEQMLWSPMLMLYNEILNKTRVPGYVVAPILLEKLTELRRQGVEVEKINSEAMVKVFEEFSIGTITKAAIEEILKHKPESAKEVDAIIRALNLQKLSSKSLEAMVYELKRQGKSNDEIVKEIMSKNRLRVDGAELNKILNIRKR